MSETTCKYTSQYDGITRCSEPVHDLGFCLFHREAVDRGDIDLDGVLSDSCVDQVRRRAINYHGMKGLPVNPDTLPR